MGTASAGNTTSGHGGQEGAKSPEPGGRTGMDPSTPGGGELLGKDLMGSQRSRSAAGHLPGRILKPGL